MELRPTPSARLFAFVRSQADLSQTSFALLLDTSKATLSRIENGNGNPTAKQYKHLAQAFGLTPAQLVEAQYARLLVKQPGRGYTPELPGMHDLSTEDQAHLWVLLTDDYNHLKRTIQHREKKLLDTHVLEEVRSASQEHAQRQLESQQAVLAVLQQTNAAPQLIETQRNNVALAEKELKSIQGWSHMRLSQQAYHHRQLNQQKAELNKLQEDIEALKRAMDAAKAANLPRESAAIEPAEGPTAQEEPTRPPAQKEAVPQPQAANAAENPQTVGQERVHPPRLQPLVPIRVTEPEVAQLAHSATVSSVQRMKQQVVRSVP